VTARALSIRPLVACALGAALVASAACGGSPSDGSRVLPPGATATVTATTQAAAATASASSASSEGGDGPGVDAASRVDSGQRIVVTVAGEDYGLKNGGTVRLGRGITVDLFLDPFPPTTLSSTLDVYLQRDGRAVEDGFVSVAYDMLAMDHGPFGASAQAIGGGHFLVPLDYIMFGAWDQTLTIRADDLRTELRVVVIARP